MKNQETILRIVAKGISEAASKVDGDYKVVVCTERIFVDDYQPQADEYEKRRVGYEQGVCESPEEMPFRNTIFFVLKLGSGQANMAVTNMPMTIQCMSEENDFVIAQAILREFIASVNFEYIDGVVQTYFTPEVSLSSQEVYAGFRALISCRGYIRMPEDGVAFIVDAFVMGGDGDWFKIPFINVQMHHSASPDPMSFGGYGGSTMALNRQTTRSVSISTYLWNHIAQSGEALTRQQECENEFSKNVMKASNNMNKKFRIMLRTNIDVTDDSECDYEEIINDKCMLPAIDAWFVLTNASYAQDWGDLSTWNLTFAEAKEEEE